MKARAICRLLLLGGSILLLRLEVALGGVVPGVDDEGEPGEIRLWPDGLIPYSFSDNGYTEAQQGEILAAMKRWEYQTCVRFEPWTEPLRQDLGDTRHISFVSTGSCYSKVGWQERQPQPVVLGVSGCLNRYTILHELGHVIGMLHELERPDRDQYITVQYNNVEEQARPHFLTTAERGVQYPLYDTPYDYKSIMHYRAWAWSKNDRPSMVTTDPAYYDVIGQVSDISFFDALYVNRAYNCSDRCSSSTVGICQNGGFVGGSDCHCVCHDGFAGELCETLLPGYDRIVKWACQGGWEFHEGRCYLFTGARAGYTDAEENCKKENASLANLKTRPEIAALSRLVEEQRLKRTALYFWLGMKRAADDDEVHWSDGTTLDKNIITPRDESPSTGDACGKFDGTTVTLTSCAVSSSTGAICVKDFDWKCGGRFGISGEGVSLQSPGYPEPYPAGLTCRYVLQSEENTRIALTFNSFSLGDCTADYLEVILSDDVTQEGTRVLTTASLPLNGQQHKEGWDFKLQERVISDIERPTAQRRYCGNDLQDKTLTSEGNMAVLTFKSSSPNKYQGFKVSTQATPLYTWTTPNPFPLLDSIKLILGQIQDNMNKQSSSLSSLWKIVKSMTFSKVH